MKNKITGRKVYPYVHSDLVECFYDNSDGGIAVILVRDNDAFNAMRSKLIRRERGFLVLECGDNTITKQLLVAPYDDEAFELAKEFGEGDYLIGHHSEGMSLINIETRESVKRFIGLNHFLRCICEMVMGEDHDIYNTFLDELKRLRLNARMGGKRDGDEDAVSLVRGWKTISE